MLEAATWGCQTLEALVILSYVPGLACTTQSASAPTVRRAISAISHTQRGKLLLCRVQGWCTIASKKCYRAKIDFCYEFPIAITVLLFCAINCLPHYSFWLVGFLRKLSRQFGAVWEVQESFLEISTVWALMSKPWTFQQLRAHTWVSVSALMELANPEPRHKRRIGQSKSALG